MTYLDHAATAPLRPEALQAMMPFLTADFGNPGSAHPLGMAAREALESARAQVAALVRADAGQVVFASGATEANNLAIRGVIEPLLRAGKKPHAVTTAIEHPSVAATFEALAAEGLALTIVPAGPDGVVTAQAVLEALRPETVIVSMMRVNNELGTIQPVEAVAAGLKAVKSAALLHTDAVQSPASLFTDMHALGADLLTLSAHKIGGPKGAGALVVRKGIALGPVLTGGGQERSLRSGTENVPAVVGFGAAAKLAWQIPDYASLQASLDGALAGSGAKRLLPPGTPAAPHIAALEVPGADADFLVLLLGREGVMVSAGSACNAGSRDASRILLAIGLSPQRAKSVIRLSFGPTTSPDDIGAFAKALKTVLPKART